VNDSGFIKTILLAGRFLWRAQSSRTATLSSESSAATKNRVGIEYYGGVCRKNEPRTQLHLGPQLILCQFGISHVNVKNAGVRSGRKCLFEEAFLGNQINTILDILSLFNLGRGLKQCKYRRRHHRAPEIDLVGAVFRGLEIKNSRKRHIGAPVENQTEYAVFIVVNKQDHCFSEMLVAEAAARHQQLPTPNSLGFLN